jgi:hypothetical protein
MIENAPEWVIKLLEHLQKGAEDVCNLTAASARKDAIEIDINDIKEHYNTWPTAPPHLLVACRNK